jgi:hypothetical protein
MLAAKATAHRYEITEEEKSLWSKGNFIGAMRAYRQRAGVGLKLTRERFHKECGDSHIVSAKLLMSESADEGALSEKKTELLEAADEMAKSVSRFITWMTDTRSVPSPATLSIIEAMARTTKKYTDLAQGPDSGSGDPANEQPETAAFDGPRGQAPERQGPEQEPETPGVAAVDTTNSKESGGTEAAAAPLPEFDVGEARGPITTKEWVLVDVEECGIRREALQHKENTLDHLLGIFGDDGHNVVRPLILRLLAACTSHEALERQLVVAHDIDNKLQEQLDHEERKSKTLEREVEQLKDAIAEWADSAKGKDEETASLREKLDIALKGLCDEDNACALVEELQRQLEEAREKIAKFIGDEENPPPGGWLSRDEVIKLQADLKAAQGEVEQRGDIIDRLLNWLDSDVLRSVTVTAAVHGVMISRGDVVVEAGYSAIEEARALNKGDGK